MWCCLAHFYRQKQSIKSYILMEPSLNVTCDETLSVNVWVKKREPCFSEIKVLGSLVSYCFLSDAKFI